MVGTYLQLLGGSRMMSASSFWILIIFEVSADACGSELEGQASQAGAVADREQN